ncbi:uncharacterized protein isoform X3 [Leptinotarsa decemlineata]|uniref:uncharacterized protein isoform X3 n=1 Tax=Leptinotarsa decemlineata TaxID=7539 RepID=UPI003D30BA76
MEEKNIESECSVNIADITSPSQLEEVTLDQEITFSNTMGLRSPGGPMRGRSVKEFEEQLSNLKKENFNLKLRIYFLEEKMGSHFTLDNDNVVKKYIELQVEYSNLQKEVQEKHELLCQAVKAMELEDEEHKKYVASKEEQLNMCQQELEDLRMQLQDTKFDSDGLSLKSDTTGFYSSRATNSGSLVPELQEKIKMLETELQLEKENNASLQFIIGQAETLKTRYDNMQKESSAKDETIKNLHEEIDAANKKIMECSSQIKETQEKLEAAYRENQSLHKRIVTDSRKFEELAAQLNELKKKYAASRADLEREHKRNERLKATYDAKTSDLEKDSDKQKAKIRDLQAKLETALVEIRKNQNLAVSKSPAQKSTTPNTDVSCFSVPDATAPAGAAQADALHVQVATPGGTSAPPSPDASFGVSFEEAVRAAGEYPGADKILSEYRKLRGEYEAQKQKMVKVKKEQFKACEIIKSMIDSRNQANVEIAELRKKVDETNELRRHVKQLEHELESVVSKPTSDGDETSMQRVANFPGDEKPMAESKTEDIEIAEHYKALILELEAKIEILVATLNEKDLQMQKIRQQYEEILTNLEAKENRIATMQSELQISPDAEEFSLLEETDVIEKHSSFYRKEIEEKDREIGRLTTELKKCTCYLQEIVNKELWEKNKEIEKLHSKQANSSESFKLKQELVGKDEEIETLKVEVADLKIQVEHCEKLREESNEVCSLLNTRLEELALFLDSLLKQKSVLGFLGLQKERKLRVLVNNSLDMSKSFAMSLLINPDQSLAQLSNITSLLNGSAFHDLTLSCAPVEEESQEVLSIIPKDITLTYQSHLYKQNRHSVEPNNEDLIAALREQVVNLKSELQLRDIELSKVNANLCNKTSDSDTDLKRRSGFKDISKLFSTPVKCNTTSTTLKYQSECQSESEGWSEPDRVVSRARIGLSQTLPNFVVVRNELSESTEEESAYCLTPTKKTSEDKRQLEQRVLDLQGELYKKNEELEVAESRILNTVGRELYEELKIRLAGAEERLANAELKKAEAEHQIKVLEKTVEELTSNKEKLQEAMVVKDKETQDAMNRLEVEKNEVLRISAEFEKESSRAKNEIEQFRAELERARRQLAELEEALRREYEQMALAKLKEAEEEFLQRLKLSEEKVSKLEERYTREFVRKSEVESKLAQVDKLIEQLDELKSAVKAYKETIQSYKDREASACDRLRDSQERINCLRKELDQVTLQYSEAVLEKTKLANEKTSLEQELSRYSLRDIELKQQIADIRKEFDDVNQSCQQQVSALQKQKSALEVKISEIESSNAELRNKLVRLQASRVDLNASLPNFIARSPPQAVPYYRHLSNTNYSSEDNAEDAGVRAFSRRPQAVDVERQEATSSPDLGIESDHGRFSSLEAPANVMRPLKQTIELTESMSNLLDGDNNPLEVASCDGDVCCRRTIEIAHENNELKRKLMRMKRALEETAAQLSLANQRKKQVEKTICKQIHKTSQVLRKAKANLDSGSESDMLNKM